MEAETERHLARIGVRDLAAYDSAAAVNGTAAVRRDRPRTVDGREAARPGRADGQPRHERGRAAVLRAGRICGRPARAIVYISHRLKEIESLADRAVVLRDGRNAGLLHRGELTRDRLVQLMVGRARRERPRAARRRARHPTWTATDAARLHVDRVRTRRYPGAEVSLTVNRGEVLGVAGLIGAGRSELAETICGVGTASVGHASCSTGSRWRSIRRATPFAPGSAWCRRTAAAAAWWRG